MISIRTYEVSDPVCEALGLTLDAASIKHKLIRHSLDALSNDEPFDQSLHVAIFSLLDRDLDAQQLADMLEAENFMLPTIVLDDSPIEDGPLSTLREPIVDIVKPGPIQLLANSLMREVRLQQYKRLVTQTRNQTRDEHHRLQTVLDHTEDGVAVIHEGVYLDINKAYCRIFGIPQKEGLPGMPVREFLTESDPEDLSCSIASEGTPLNTSLGTLQNNTLHSVHIQKRDGESFITTLIKTPCTLRGKSCFQLLVHNPDAWSDLDKNFLDLRSQDVETGLLNRHFFLERMESIVKSYDGSTQGALAFILLDNFREIRDDCGIKTSDAMIQSVAQSLQDLTDGGDLLCRFGDHMFTYYSCQLDQSGFLHRCEEMRQRIDEQLFGKHESFTKLSVSIGVSFLNRHVLNVQQLISQADNACDKASSQGGNQIQVFKTVPTSLDTIEDEQAHVQSIKLALEDNRLHAMFQPIVHLSGNKVENYAVLLRMLDVDGSHILPDQFILAAEQSGLVCQLDLWVLRNTIQLLKSSADHKPPRCFFLKLSIQSVKNPEFLEALFADLKFHNIKGSQLVFQVDYAEALPEHQAVKQFVHSIKKHSGCQFAFDHVGFGEITDQTIKNFGVNYIKIDGTFTRNLVNNPGYQNTVKQVLEVTKRNRIPAIAKSVEDANTLATLWNLGIDYVQGYFLQRPSDNLDFDFSEINQ